MDSSLLLNPAFSEATGPRAAQKTDFPFLLVAENVVYNKLPCFKKSESWKKALQRTGSKQVASLDGVTLFACRKPG